MIFIYILIILQKYTTISRFYSFDNHLSWPTAAAMAHDDFRSSRRGPRRFGNRPWAPIGVEVSHCGPQRLTTNRCALRQQGQPP
jgi:hypothetical protein